MDIQQEIWQILIHPLFRRFSASAVKRLDQKTRHDLQLASGKCWSLGIIIAVSQTRLGTLESLSQGPEELV